MIIKVQDRIQVNSDERVAINLGAERYTTRQHTDKLEVAYSDSFQVVPFAKRITVDYTMPSSMLDGFITDIDALRADILQEIGAREVAIIDSTSYNRAYVDGKVKQTYLDVKANYIGNEQAKAYILDTEIADMEITYDTGSGNTVATFQGLNDTVVSVENSQASYTEDLQIVVDNVSANTEYTTTLAAEAGGIAASVISTEGVSAGVMHTWDGDEVLKIGYLYDFGEGTMQYLGGMLGDGNDGWVKYNSTIHKVLSDSMASEALVTAGLIEELQHQVDGNIITWFNEGAPEFLSTDALYSSDVGSKDVVADDFVWSTSAVQMFKYIGTDATIDLSTINYLTDSDWLAIYKISPTENAWFSADGIDTSNDYYWYDSDGKIVPLTDADTPAVSTERVRHIGDLYYDKLTGYAYRFAYEDIVDSPDKGIIYSWIIITDVDVTKALGDAAEAQDTADGKRVIYYEEDAPTHNSKGVLLGTLDKGDMWVSSATDVTMIWSGSKWANVTNSTANEAITRIDAIDTTLGQHTLDIANNDGLISDEEAARITAINTEATARATDIAARVSKEALLDGRVDDAEAAQITSANNLTTAYKNYSNVVTRAMADGVLTNAEKTLISAAQDDIDTSLANLKTATDTANEAHGWAAGASKLITDPSTDAITGWSFGDGSGVASEFKINANQFIVSNGDNSHQPFTIDTTTGKSQFNGVVNFTNTNMDDYSNSNIPVVDTSNLANKDMSNVTTIDGGKITTGTIDANKVNVTNIDASNIKAGIIYNSGGDGTNYTMKIDLDNGEIYIA